MENYFQPELSRGSILEISSIGLAHMGDAVFELLVRAWLCAHGGATGRGMHRSAVRLVCAESQAEKAEKILPLLTEEERAGIVERNSPLTGYVYLSPNADFPRKGAVSKITIHHMAGDLTLEELGASFSREDRRGSYKYGIGSQGGGALCRE